MQNLETLFEHKGFLVEASTEATQSKESSIFIMIIQAISGMLSSILVLVFLAFTLGGVFESSIAMVILGALFIGIAYLFLRKNTNEFLEYFALVFAMVGEWFMLFGLAELLQLTHTMSIMGIMLAFVVLFFIVDSTLHRFISAIIVLWAGYYLAILFNFANFYYNFLTLAMVWIWLNEYKNINKIEIMQSLGYASVVFLLYIIMTQMQLQEFFYGLNIFPFSEDDGIQIPSFVLTIVYVLTVSISVGMILRKVGLSMHDKLLWLMLVAANVFAFTQPMLLSLFVPTLVLLLAFYGKNKILFILGLLAMVLNIFYFYSMMFIDFMTKSKTLVIFGIIVLVLALFLHVYLKKHEEVLDA